MIIEREVGALDRQIVGDRKPDFPVHSLGQRRLIPKQTMVYDQQVRAALACLRDYRLACIHRYSDFGYLSLIFQVQPIH
jgi:hypothetical protein